MRAHISAQRGCLSIHLLQQKRCPRLRRLTIMTARGLHRKASMAPSAPSRRRERFAEFEHGLVSFGRGLLAGPEIWLCDGLCAGLARPEVQRAARFDALYRRHFPFRTALYIDAHDLAVPGLEEHPLIHL